MSLLDNDIIIRVRRDARHGSEPLSERAVQRLWEDHGMPKNVVREAEQEGRRQRRAGMRCYCAACEVVDTKVVPHETLRYRYAERRHAELEAAGVHSWSQRGEQIQREIDAGAALQAAPVRVIRTKGPA